MGWTRSRKVLVAMAQKAATEGEWTAIAGNTIRWMRTMPTPDWAKKERPTSVGKLPALWDEDTFNQLVFLTFIGMDGEKPSIIKRVCRAPWIECQDSTVSQRQAMEIIETPEGEFSG